MESAFYGFDLDEKCKDGGVIDNPATGDLKENHI